jgi:hypothetical protein
MFDKASRSQEGVMSEADQFRRYADEAMRWARQSKTEKEKRTTDPTIKRNAEQHQTHMQATISAIQHRALVLLVFRPHVNG